MRIVVRGLCLMAAAMLLANCGGTSASTKPADVCGAAFAAAAGVDANADSVSDLYPAVRACTSVAAWSAAFAANNGAGFSGTATSVLSNVCTAPEVATESLCQLVK
jgi:hypothetical protein